MGSQRTWGILALALFLSCAGKGERPDAPVVRSLEIEGTRKVDDDDLKKHIVTAETSWVPFSAPMFFDANAWQADLRRIERYYQAHGYYEAQVLDEKVMPRGK